MPVRDHLLCGQAGASVPLRDHLLFGPTRLYPLLPIRYCVPPEPLHLALIVNLTRECDKLRHEGFLLGDWWVLLEPLLELMP